MRTIGEYYIATKVKYISSVVLSQSLDDLGTTRGECLGRTRWSSPLDWTTYLYYFYKWLYTTSPRSHVLLEYSTITWPHHMIWLLKFPHYLYLVSIVWLDVCSQVFECVGDFFLLRALITFWHLDPWALQKKVKWSHFQQLGYWGIPGFMFVTLMVAMNLPQLKEWLISSLALEPLWESQMSN